MKRAVTAALILGVLVLSPSSDAQDPSRARNSPRAGPTVDWSKVEHRIAWYGTLEAARAEAKRTGKPMLFVSGAPHCGTTPGVW